MINNLTGLRFYLAFWVAIYHLPGLIDVAYLNAVIKKGYLAVDIFFVLSGYILTHVYIQFFTSSVKGQNITIFVKKRFAKIYPVHLATLIAAIVYYNMLNLVIHPQKELAYDQISHHALLIHSWGMLDVVSWNFPSWSISAEWFAYIFIFPLSFTIYRLFGFRLFSVIIFAGLILFFCYTEYTVNGSIVTQMEFGLIRVSTEFMYGIFAYLFLKNFNARNPSTRMLTYALWFGAGFSIFLINYTRFDYYFILAIPFLFFLLHKSKSKVISNIFANPVAIFLGEVSFSLYMMHFFAIRILGILNNNFFGYGSNNLLSITAYIIMLVLFAIGSYYLIEQPGRKWILTLFSKNYIRKLTLNATKTF